MPVAMTCSEGAPFWDLQSCIWSCPPTTASSGGKCYPNDRAVTAALKDACYAATDPASCPPTQCIWKDAAVPSGETPLFTKEFCHPIEIDSGKAE